jgi:hypothetical protein
VSIVTDGLLPSCQAIVSLFGTIVVVPLDGISAAKTLVADSTMAAAITEATTFLSMVFPPYFLFYSYLPFCDKITNL